jgi:hypothetical protein
MQKIAISCLAAGLLFSSPSAAQTFQYNVPQNGHELQQAYGAEPFIRIQVTFRASLQASSADLVADASILETARKSLYGQAQRECAVLSEQFNKADCRLGALSINLNTFSLPSNPQPPQLTAIASYWLKMK